MADINSQHRRRRQERACRYGDRNPETRKCPRKPYLCKYGPRNPETKKCPKKSEQRRYSRKSPTKVIARFMHKTSKTGRRQAAFLRNICSDSGQCISFGVEVQKINAFFNFNSFKYLVPPIVQIGNLSANGFIKLLNYERLGYTAHAVFKSAQDSQSDNLFYEFFVGLHVNNWVPFFPCFVETYGLFNYMDDVAYQDVKQNPRIQDVAAFDYGLNLVMSAKTGSNTNINNFNLVQACIDAKRLALLVQNIPNAVSLHDELGYNGRIDSNALYAILLQVYLPLAALANQFTHNDLHADNVLLYSPSADKYIQFHYYFADGSEVSFNSYYVAKIIDYGRCFTSNSLDLYNQLCKTNECGGAEWCGKHRGFFWMKPIMEKNWFISSTTYNPSTDLRLFNKQFPDLVKYGVGIRNKKHKSYGTKPNEKSGLHLKNIKIHNVMDAAKFLTGYIQRNPQIYLNSPHEFPPNYKFGDIHVYMDMSKPMRFEKA